MKRARSTGKKGAKMDILAELETFINDFNKTNNEDFSIDTIRVAFKKQHKLEHLQDLGVWKKINAKDTRILSKLKKRLTADEVTSAYQLKNENIYYYNSSRPPKYRDATLVIFGMKQYHKEPPKRELLTKILSILKSVSNIDICLDIKQAPNIEALRKYFLVERYFTSAGVPTDTYYINDPLITMIEKITIYNKAYKNGLDGVLHRIEAKIIIPNFRDLAIPLYELKEITGIARGN